VLLFKTEFMLKQISRQIESSIAGSSFFHKTPGFQSLLKFLIALKISPLPNSQEDAREMNRSRRRQHVGTASRDRAGILPLAATSASLDGDSTTFVFCPLCPTAKFPRLGGLFPDRHEFVARALHGNVYPVSHNEDEFRLLLRELVGT
jgi:hypothetical protein